MEGQVFTSYPFSGCHWDPDIIFEVRSPAAYVCSLECLLPLFESAPFGLEQTQQRHLVFFFPVANSSIE